MTDEAKEKAPFGYAEGVVGDPAPRLAPKGKYNFMCARNGCKECDGTGRLELGVLDVLSTTRGSPLCDCVRAYPAIGFNQS
jgi:hypothetical protein